MTAPAGCRLTLISLYKPKQMKTAHRGKRRIFKIDKRKSLKPYGFRDFLWQRVKDSNPHRRSQSPACYHYTNPLSVVRRVANRYYYTKIAVIVKPFFRFFQIISKKASPAVALSRWDKDHREFTVSTKTLYRYIDAGIYFPNLTNKDLPERPYRKHTYNHIRKTKRPPKGTSIELRPREIGKRESFGHWEMDCVVGKKEGKKEAVLVLTERLTRYEIIVKLQDKTSNSVVSALDKLQRKYDFNLFNSITVDNGSKFQDCRGMEYDSKGNKRTQLYYCHPYASCERGTNERHNRIIRRFLKKGHSMAKVTQKECYGISEWMNNYPRKILGWRTPADLFQEYAV